MEAENRLAAAKAWQEGWTEKCCLMGTGVTWGMIKSCKLDSSNDYATLCRYPNATKLYILKWLGLEIVRKGACYQT